MSRTRAARSFHAKLQKAAANLGCAAGEDHVAAACVVRANSIADCIAADLSPAERLEAFADHYSVVFEVAPTTAHLDAAVKRYAKAGELGFLARRKRFDSDLVAAILRRRVVPPGGRRFVAMIDARGRRAAMAFHSKAHEVAHPALEPQLDMDFREETTKRDAWEALVDRVASEMVFAGERWTISARRALRAAGRVDVSAIHDLRNSLAPEASTTAVALAAANTLGRSVMVLWCGEESSKRDPIPALRVLQVTPSCAARDRTAFVHRKCRIPPWSGITNTWRSGERHAAREDFGKWVDRPGQEGWVSAIRAADGVQVIIDLS